MTDKAYISGWIETEQGAVLFDYEDVEDYGTLAQTLYLKFGEKCAGVDIEVDGVYLDGTDASTQMVELLDDLDFLCN
jgi:hypothetical protein